MLGGSQQDKRRIGLAHDTVDGVIEVAWFELDGQVDGKVKARGGRVGAEPRRLMKARLGSLFSHQIEGAGHRLSEACDVHFVYRG